MKASFNSKRVALTLALAGLFLSPVIVAQDQSSLTLQDVKSRLETNKGYIAEAKSKGQAGDAAGMQTALDNYNRSMDGINTALSHDGGFTGNNGQREDALSRVSDATSKHIETLQGLLSKVPAQAQGAIQNAINLSQKGHDMATASLQASQAQHQSQSGRPSGVGGGRPAGVGAPAGAGRPSGHPGRP
jgi:hypothetical protein